MKFNQTLVQAGGRSNSRAPVSILVPTLNEEKNLPTCLASCIWAEQVVVLDSFSGDRTEEIARSHGAEFVQHQFENYSAQKNWALDNVRWRNPWIFVLDADERFTPELIEEIRRVVAAPEASDGYYVNRRFIFLGKWIKHCGWYPNWNLRLFKRGRARYDGRVVHEHMVVDGSVAYLEHDIVHEDLKGLQAFLERHNRYSSLEAATRLNPQRDRPTLAQLRHPIYLKRFLRQWVWPHLPAKPAVVFAYMYGLRGGFLDGWAGAVFSLLQAQQELHVQLKMAELRSVQGRK